jgi:hypothetical protein
MIARFAPAELKVDTSGLSAGDKQALQKLLEAANLIDKLFLTQRWSGNAALLAQLQKDTSALGKARLHYFDLNKGPWSDLDGQIAFLPGVPPKKLPGSNFYPEDMTKDEFETWVAKLPQAQQEQARGFFTVIRRSSDKKPIAVPYSKAYAQDLEHAAKLLEEAAAMTPNASLKEFLKLRAQAFRTDDYYTSDVAWMKLDAPIDITIGPYETYNDELLGYKAAFEAYVTLRDGKETAKMKNFADHIQEIENNLPLDSKYKNPKLGALAPIRVVNQIVATGDGAHGVRTAAFNLPNDERIVRQMGSKRVMLKNVQEAKFTKILQPIAGRVLSGADQKDLSFDSFFTHILAHEMTHGIGPQTNVRQSLKETHGPIEEAKFLASSFRTLRFGVHEAHGRGMAMQVNYLMDKGAFIAKPDGTFTVDFTKVKGAVRDLVHELLEVEATGDYGRAKKMLDELGVIRPAMAGALDKLKDLPTDIEPIRPPL